MKAPKALTGVAESHIGTTAGSRTSTRSMTNTTNSFTAVSRSSMKMRMTICRNILNSKNRGTLILLETTSRTRISRLSKEMTKMIILVSRSFNTTLRTATTDSSYTRIRNQIATRNWRNCLTPKLLRKRKSFKKLEEVKKHYMGLLSTRKRGKIRGRKYQPRETNSLGLYLRTEGAQAKTKN